MHCAFIFSRKNYKLPSVVRQLKTSQEAWSLPYCQTKCVCVCVCVGGGGGGSCSVVRKSGRDLVLISLPIEGTP